MLARALALTVAISFSSTVIVVAVDQGQAVNRISAVDGLNQVARIYGAGSRVHVDPAARADLSRAVISTAGGDNIDLFWTGNAALFLAEIERRGKEGERVEERRSIVNDGIALTVFALPDGRWTVQHVWMDYEGVMRAAISTASSRDHAEQVVSKLATAREQGLFGGYAWIGGPLPESPQTNE